MFTWNNVQESVCLLQANESARQDKWVALRVNTDSRALRPGDLFVALRGKIHDGHIFVHDALKNGAVAAIVDDPRYLDENHPVICVRDTLGALQDLALSYRKRYDIPVVAITGSCGKTTTKEMLAHICRSRFSVVYTPANNNNQIGVPLTILSMEPATTLAILEMGINEVGEMENLSRVAQPTVAIITNIHPAHLQGLRNIETIVREKSKILGSLADNGVFIYPQEDERLAAVAQQYKGRSYAVVCGESSPLQHDAQLALAAAEVLGIDRAWAEAEMASFAGVRGRFYIESLMGVQVIDDTYNANPASFAMGLDVLKDWGCKRKILFVGEMKELGEESALYHRQLAQNVIDCKPDAVYFIGYYAHDMAAVLAANVRWQGHCEAFADVDEAIQKCLYRPHPGDVVYFKGSHSVRVDKMLQVVRDMLTPTA